jgi:hypothetical protein
VLSGPFLPTGSQSDDEPFEIPSVQHLKLQYEDPLSPCALIQHFYFPNLRSLALNVDLEDFTFFVEKLLVPVKGRSTSILSGLESLKIFRLPCNIATTEAMLKQLTNLKVFELDCFGSEEMVIFRKLIDPMAGHKKKEEAQISAIAKTLPNFFCPLLETFTVTSVSESGIKRLVMARKVAGAPLKTLRLRYNCMSKKTQEWLKNHVEVLEFFKELAIGVLGLYLMDEVLEYEGDDDSDSDYESDDTQVF